MLNRGILKSISLDNRTTSHCHQNLVGLNTLLLALALEGDSAIGYTLHCRLHIELHALLLQLLAKTLGYVGIKGWNALLEELNNRYLSSQLAEDACELHSYHSCSNNAEATGEGSK